VKQAQRQPQRLTSHGQPVAVVVSAEAWQRQQLEGESLVDFIRRSPLADTDDLDLERNRDEGREIAIKLMAGGCSR
jgi:prevent-host-death family protein